MKTSQRHALNLFTVVILAAVLWVGAPFPSVQAATIHVPADQPTIQAAINSAVNSDTVLVAPGTYVENINFRGKAITVISEQGPEATIVDGNQAAPVVTFNSAEGPASVFEGFTVRNGNGNFPFTVGGGGGIRVQESIDVPPYNYASPIIRGNVVSNNRACEGAGISVSGGSAVITQNVVVDNVAWGCYGAYERGAGISVSGGTATIVDNVIADNSEAGVSLSGGIPVVRGNTISRNHGSGVYINESQALIIQNLITGNTVAENGGTFIKGGGIAFFNLSFSRPLLAVNNTIADNDSPSGSGIYVSGFFDGQGGLINNIVIGKAGQTALVCDGLGGTKGPPIHFNNIFTPGVQAIGGSCADQNGLNGNISADPLFLDPSIGEFHLNTGSPVIDTGDNTAPEIPGADFDGGSRIVDGDENGVAIVDMGAFEFSPTVGVLQFSSSTFTVSESTGQATITVTRGGGTKGQVSVDFAASAGTATAGSDFIVTSGTVTFADKESTKTFEVPVINDTVPEGMETVSLTLSNPTGGAVLGVRRSAVLSIENLFTAADFFPFTPADAWTYRRVADGAVFTISVADKITVINGVETRMFQYSDGSAEYYAVNADGIRLYRQYMPSVPIQGLGRVNLTVTFNPPIELVNGVTQIGQTVVSNGTVATNKLPKVGVVQFPYSASFTVMRFDNINVPAGNFDVVRLEGEVEMSGQAPSDFIFELADGIGIVRSTTTQLGITETLELVSTNVAPFSINAASLPDGEQNTPYFASIAIHGDSGPYVVDIIKGSLPAGLTIDNEGNIAGIPSASGRAKSFTVRVSQSGSYVTKSFKINVLKAVSISTKNLKTGTVGRNYSTTLKARGGKGPFNWFLVSGSLPAGFALNGATGAITGVPAEKGTFTPTIKVTDALGGAAQKAFTLTVK